MFCVINVGKKINSWEGVYSIRNSEVIERNVRAFSSIYVIMVNSENDCNNITLFRIIERNWSPLLKFYISSW